MQNTPFRLTASASGLFRFTQARRVGGSADTELNALTVMAKRPAGPSVDTIETPVATLAIAPMKASRLAMVALVTAPGYYPDGTRFSFKGITPDQIITDAPKEGLVNLAAAYLVMKEKKQ